MLGAWKLEEDCPAPSKRVFGMGKTSVAYTQNNRVHKDKEGNASRVGGGRREGARRAPSLRGCHRTLLPHPFTWAPKSCIIKDRNCILGIRLIFTPPCTYLYILGWEICWERTLIAGHSGVGKHPPLGHSVRSRQEILRPFPLNPYPNLISPQDGLVGQAPQRFPSTQPTAVLARTIRLTAVHQSPINTIPRNANG